MILSNISFDVIASYGGFILSFISLVASGVTFFVYNKRLNKQNLRINEFTLREQKEKEEDSKKAVINIDHIYYGSGSGDIIISNVGKSDARNLKINIDEKDDSGIHWRIGKLFPYSCLTPGSSIKFHYGLLSGYQVDPIVTFEWDDDFSDNRTSRHSVFLG